MKVLVDRETFADKEEELSRVRNHLLASNIQIVTKITPSITHVLVANVTDYRTGASGGRYCELLQKQRTDIQLLDSREVFKFIPPNNSQGDDIAANDDSLKILAVEEATATTTTTAPPVRRSKRQRKLAEHESSKTESNDPKTYTNATATTATAVSINTNTATNTENKQETRKLVKPKQIGRPGKAAAQSETANETQKSVAAVAEHAEEKKMENTNTLKKEIRKGRAVVDSSCSIANQVHVFEDKSAGAVYDAMLNQTNIGANNNKFYLLQLLQSDAGDQFYTWFRWGRVGAAGQNNLQSFGGNLTAAKHAFESKFRSKTLNDWREREQFQHYPGKYDLLERDYGEEIPAKEDSANKQVSSRLPPPVQQLIGLIFDVNMMRRTMVEIGYDAERMPLGKLTKNHVQKGYRVLEEIAALLNSGSNPSKYVTQQISFHQTVAVLAQHLLRPQLTELSSRFYTIIPHDFGFRHPPLISTNQQVKEKLQMVESLAEMQIATSLMQANASTAVQNPLDNYYSTLCNEIQPLDPSSVEFALIQRYVDRTHCPTHAIRVTVRQVFSVRRHGEQERFEPVAKHLQNRMLLWHGSRLSNWVGILSQGLRIAPPEAPATGYMFGKGIYFADMVTKSANYCYTSSRESQALLVLCEVALGRVRELQQSDYGAAKWCKAGGQADSTKGCGRTAPDQQEWQTLNNGEVVVPCGKPVTNPDICGALLYNEYIVYSTDQCCMRYLVQVDIN